jgi:hypothetical protein
MSDKIIQFPGGTDRPDPDPDRLSPVGEGALGLAGLTVDQEKAIQLVLSGMSFVCIGVSPTATGADFYTAVDGKREDLEPAKEHLGGILADALKKRGV